VTAALPAAGKMLKPKRRQRRREFMGFDPLSAILFQFSIFPHDPSPSPGTTERARA
jgi:hypothetical protein